MRRKPDILTILAILIGLGVLVTGFTQEVQREHGASVSQVSSIQP